MKRAGVMRLTRPDREASQHRNCDRDCQPRGHGPWASMLAFPHISSRPLSRERRDNAPLAPTVCTPTGYWRSRCTYTRLLHFGDFVLEAAGSRALQRPLYCLGLMFDHAQIELRRSIRLALIQLPRPHRRRRQAEPRRELVLRQARALADRLHVHRPMHNQPRHMLATLMRKRLLQSFKHLGANIYGARLGRFLGLCRSASGRFLLHCLCPPWHSVTRRGRPPSAPSSPWPIR
jgi:hypothetical protein